MKWEPFASYMGDVDDTVGPASDKSVWGPMDRTAWATLEISKPLKEGQTPDFLVPGSRVHFSTALTKALGDGCQKSGCGKWRDMSAHSDLAERMAETAAATQLFGSVDKNDDGILSHTELKKHLQNQPWALPFLKSEGFHWADLWAAYDQDGDGHIDEGEFVRMYHEKLLPLQAKVPMQRYQVQVWSESCSRPRQIAARLYALAGSSVCGFHIDSAVRRAGHKAAY